MAGVWGVRPELPSTALNAGRAEVGQMGDALLIESTLGVVVGVNSRLWWAEEWEVRKKLSLCVLQV